MRYILTIFAICLIGTLSAQERIDIWEGVEMPNSKGLRISDSVANRRMVRVGRPALYRVAPPEELNRGIAVVICPGGGYQRYAWEVAGFDVARHFASLGITGFVFTARLPQSEDVVEPSIVGCQDLQRALRVIRSRAAEWGIDPEKVGVEGSSAGGHLAASSAVFVEPLYEGVDSIDLNSHLPNFQILVSPVISMKESITHKGSRTALLGSNPSEAKIRDFSLECGVGEWSAPAIMIHADDDKTVPSENSIEYYLALRNVGVEASLHIFPEGGHKISLQKQPIGTELWIKIVERWLDNLYGEGR